MEEIEKQVQEEIEPIVESAIENNSTEVSPTGVDPELLGEVKKDHPKIEQPVESIDMVNFRKLRIAKNKAEEERDELYGRLARIDRERESAPRKNETEAQANKREIREIKNERRMERNIAETRNIENRLKDTYPDLEEVINSDNIEKLKDLDPNFARLVRNGSKDPNDLYHRVIAAYSLIKKHGIHVSDAHAGDRARVENNMAKPRPAVAASTTSEGLSEFAGFVNMNTEDRRRAIFEMARKRANG